MSTTERMSLEVQQMLVRLTKRMAETSAMHESESLASIRRLLEADLAFLRRGETETLWLGSGELRRLVIDTLPLDDPLGHALCDMDHTAKRLFSDPGQTRE